MIALISVLTFILLARMREEYDQTRDTDEAVVFGLARTGRLVTSAR